MENSIANRVSALSRQQKRLLARRLVAGKSHPYLHLPFPREANEAVPASYGQERVLIAHELDSQGDAYNTFLALHLCGPLRRAALFAAIRQLVRRHAVLRTRFELRPEGAMQFVEEDCEPTIRLVDITGVHDALERAIRLARSETGRPFDLSRGPVIRALLLHVERESHVLVLTIHHIASDRWSAGIIRREILSMYGSEPGAAALPPLALQYADFAAWQRLRVRENLLQAQVDYWRAQLLPLAPKLTFGRGTRGATERRQAGRVRRDLSGALVKEMELLGKRYDATVFVSMLLVFQLLLRRLTRETDILVGTPVTTRATLELQSLLGFFLNTVLLRLRLHDGMSFEESLSEARRVHMEAMANAEVPFEVVCESCGLSQDNTPPYQVLFTLNDPHQPLLGGFEASDETAFAHGLTIKTLFPDIGGIPSALALHIERSAERAMCVLDYDARVLNAEEALQLLESYVSLVAAVASAPDRKLGGYALLTPAERDREATLGNATATDYPREACIGELFAAAVRADPCKVALEHHDVRMTYRELNAAAERLAARLQAAGVGREDRVGVLLERSAQFIVAVVAVIKAGAAYVPLSPREPAARLSQIVLSSAMKLIVTRGQHRLMLSGIAAAETILDMDDADEGGQEYAAQRPTGCALQLACVHYTSGSTGQPKGVATPHAAIVRLVRNTNYFSFSPQERIGHLSNVAFDAATFEIWGCLLNGGTAVILDFEELLGPDGPGYLSSLRLTGLFMTTALFHRLARIAPATLRDIDTLLFGGEQCDARLASLVASHRKPRSTCHVYGPTESTTFATWFPMEKDGEPPASVPIGRPVSNTQCWVLDSCMQPLPTYLTGELYIGGDGLARGYLDDPALTALRFLPDPHGPVPGARLYRTGDLVTRLPGGDLDFVGRTDNQIKLRGFRIELEEVKAALRRVLPAVEVEVVANRRGSGDAVLVAYLQTTEPLSSRHLSERVRAYLPPYMVPSAYVCIPRLPLNANGKLDPSSLPEPTWNEGPHVPPRTATEASIAEIWARTLGLQDVSCDADFFASGGSSLTALQMVAELRSCFGLEVSLRLLFENSTVAALAQAIDEIPKDASASIATERLAPHPEEKFAPFPLTELQQAYWVGRMSNMELGGVSAHAYFEIDVPGLVVSKFTAALNKLIERHDGLRIIVSSDGQQQVLREVPRYRPATLVLTELPEDSAEIERALLKIRQAMSHQVLQSDRWPLFDFRVTILPAGQVRLHASIDALISDAWSWRILIDELAGLYRNPNEQLPPLELSFRDYVMYKLRQRQSVTYARATQYWSARLEEFPPPPSLPTLQEKPTVTRFGRRSLCLDSSRWEALKENAAHVAVTSTAAVLAAFAEIISFWSANDRYALNLTSFDRSAAHKDVGRIVGDFTSTLLLEVRHDHQHCFSERAVDLQRQLWADLDHRDMGGVAVMREIRRRAGGAPVAYPIVFTSLLGLGLQARTWDLPAATCVYSISQTPQVWLDCQVYENSSGLIVTWDAVEQIFPAGMLDDMFESCRALLHRLAGEAAWRESQFPLLPDWQQKLFREVNETSAPMKDGLLHHGFLLQARRNPDNLAVITPDESTTYGELAARVASIAMEVRLANAQGSKIVAVAMEKCCAQIAAVLGILEAGYAYLPIDPQLPPKRIAFLLENAEVGLVLSHSNLHIETPPQVRVLQVDRLQPDSAAPHGQVREGDMRASSSLAYVIFTSGSTGDPKGVMISHRSALNTVEDINERLAIGPADRVLALSNLSFDLSVYDVFGTLSAGAAIVLPEARRALDPAHWYELAVEHRVSVWNSVPAMMGMFWECLRKSTWEMPADLRTVMLSGDWIPVTLAAELRQLGAPPRLISLGGATEAAIWSIYHDVERVEPEWPSIPYGRPLRNQRFRVLDGALRARPVWATGALAIEGEGLADGYWKDPVKTAQRFVRDCNGERLYLTGDLGRYLPDGNIQFLGRQDTQIKLGGYRIELGEIEAHFSRHPQVRQCVVLVGDTAAGVRQLVAFVCLKSEGQLTERQMREFLAQVLPDYMIPRVLVPCSEFPLTGNGKVDRKRLWSHYSQLAREGPRGRGGATALERLLCDIFTAELNVPGVEPEDNFFTLGGQSLAALGVVAKVKQDIGAELRLQTLFRNPTPRELAAVLTVPNLAGQANSSVGEEYETGTL